jgi:chemotaxis protein methyltransferase CheR
MQEITDPDLRALITKVRNKTGIDLGQYKDNYIVRRLSTRLKATDADSYRSYLTVLDKNPGEYDKVVDAFTINVSEFFRDKPTFELIQNKVIPAIVDEKIKSGRRNIRVWSAGCACGEEVYSLSMIINDILGKDYDKFSVRLFATDIDDVIMKKAQEGLYDPISVKNVPSSYLSKFTVTRPDGKIAVSDNVKRNVTFKRYDLIAGAGFGMYYDLILCRNVMIYFSDDQKKKLLSQFYNALSTGGYCVIGKTETLVGDARTSFEPINNLERIYRKPDRPLT